MSAPLTVGAALADPRGCVVEFEAYDHHVQLRVDGARLMRRADDEETKDGAYWTAWRIYGGGGGVHIETLALSCRLVPIASADLPPDSRGPLASPRPAEAEREEASLVPLRARAEALLAVADRATPGPWRLGRNGRDHVVDAAVPQDKGITHTIVTCHGTEDVTTPNALAIAALRDAPALIRDLLAALTGKDGAR